MNLKSIVACIALSLALAGCGNKGPLIQAPPPPVESDPAESVPAEGNAPVEAETRPVEAAPVDAAPADAPVPEAEPATDDPNG